jgi:hypothetical protein
MNGIAGDAPALEEGRGEEVGVEGPQFLRHDVGLHRVVAAQGGVGTADEEGMQRPPLARPGQGVGGQGQFQVMAGLAGDRRRLLGAHGAAVGQDEEQWRGVGQALAQGLDIPAGQEQTAVDRL